MIPIDSLQTRHSRLLLGCCPLLHRTLSSISCCSLLLRFQTAAAALAPVWPEARRVLELLVIHASACCSATRAVGTTAAGHERRPRTQKGASDFKPDETLLLLGRNRLDGAFQCSHPVSSFLGFSLWVLGCVAPVQACTIVARDLSVSPLPSPGSDPRACALPLGRCRSRCLVQHDSNEGHRSSTWNTIGAVLRHRTGESGAGCFGE